MRRGLALVWQLVDGTTFFSSRSPPALFAEFFMSSWEDSWAQRASATCRTWVKSGERKEKDEGNNSLHREWQILGDARTVSAPAAYAQSVHHNLSQSSTGHILQRHGRLKQHLKQSSFKFGKVKHLNLICVAVFALSTRWRSETGQCCRERAPGCAAGAENWEHRKFSPPAKTDEPFLCPSAQSSLCLLQTKSKKDRKANNRFFVFFFLLCWTSEDCRRELVDVASECFKCIIQWYNKLKTINPKASPTFLCSTILLPSGWSVICPFQVGHLLLSWRPCGRTTWFWHLRKVSEVSESGVLDKCSLSWISSKPFSTAVHSADAPRLGQTFIPQASVLLLFIRGSSPLHCSLQTFHICRQRRSRSCTWLPVGEDMQEFTCFTTGISTQFQLLMGGVMQAGAVGSEGS